ncbi:MAG TPA: ATP-binding protein [Allosphingosinicella sp.]|jgi:hypothetical protein
MADLSAQLTRMTAEAARYAPSIEAAKRFAALSGPFLPLDALPPRLRDEPGDAAVVASALAMVCDTNPDVGDKWLLRTGERRRVVGHLRRSETLAAAVAERRKAAADEPTRDLLAALLGEGDFAVEAVRALVERPEPPRALLERLIVALDRAGPDAPAYPLLEDVRIHIAALDRRERRKLIEERGFLGRTEEMKRLREWMATPLTRGPARAAFLSGFPGIGKSALLEEATAEANESFNSITIRLDFDRAGLDVLDLRGLTMEVARQVADRLGSAGKPLLQERLATASLGPTSSRFDGSQRAVTPRQLASAIGVALRESGRPALLVLDTLEVLRGRGEQHPPSLFRWIDDLLEAGLAPLRIIAAGRGDALDSCPDRVGTDIPVDGLERPAVDALLERLEVPVDVREEIIALADGNPLVLRLAASIAREYGLQHLPRKKLGKDVAAAFLYRFLLSRVDDPLLRKLAHPGLVARRISAQFVREVLAPKLGLARIAADEATALFEALASFHWLVTRDPSDPEFVVHRSDMRSVLLPLLYRDKPRMCASIDAAAAKWFGRREDEESQLDAAYHRLQLMRRSSARPLISARIARQFPEASLAELPQAAQNLVRETAGDRSERFRTGGRTSAPIDGDDPGLAKELLDIVDRQDWSEGQFILDRVERAGGIDPRSPAADAMRAFCWRSGSWRRARAMLAERDTLAKDDGDVADLPLASAAARLEMRAEFDPRGLAGLIREPGLDWLSRVANEPGCGSLRDGAFGFQLLAALHPLSTVSEKQPSPAIAGFHLWTGEEAFARASSYALDVARDSVAAAGLLPANAESDAVKPQLLASLAPYPAFAANLAAQSRGRIFEDAAAAAERLASAGALLSSSPQALPRSSNPIAVIASFGLFPEWVAVQAMLSRDGDFAAIGRAAERWRRTLAGDWRYGRPPRVWRSRPLLDVTLASRLNRLLSCRRPVDAAFEQLGIWAPDGEGARLLALLARRRERALTRAALVEDPLMRARKLLELRVPAAFVPALAILVHHIPNIGGGRS